MSQIPENTGLREAPQPRQTAASTRRGLPKLFAQSALRTAQSALRELSETAIVAAPLLSAAVSAVAETRGMQIPRGFMELISRTNPRLTFIPGGHATPAGWPFTPGTALPFQGETAEQVFDQVKVGDPEACIWPQIAQDQVDAHMRAAKQAGRNYYMAVDSVFFGANWWGLPHPKDTKTHTVTWGQENYPRIFVIGGETFDDFLVSDGLLPEKHTDAQETQIKQLEADVKGWYNVYSSKNEQDMTDRAIETAIQATGEVLLARGLLQPILKDSDRRTFIKTVFWSIAAMKLAGMAGLLGSAAASTDNAILQSAAEDMQSATGYPIFNERITSWLLARTAWAVEKSDYISRERGNVPVDIVYGDAHSDQIPGILTDRNFRMQIIKGFMRQHVNALKEAIVTKYHDLEPFMSSIISYSVLGTAFYTMQEIGIPWGKEKLEPNFDPVIDHKNDVFRFCPSIRDAALEVLKESGVFDPHAYQDALDAESKTS